MVELTASEVLLEVRRTLQVPEGGDIIEHARMVVSKINEIHKEVKELKLLVRYEGIK